LVDAQLGSLEVYIVVLPAVVAGAFACTTFCAPAGFVMMVEINADGGICWPDREDLSLEFTRLLGSAQDGGSTVSECWLAASRVNPADDESWYREWSALADTNSMRAAAAFSDGHLATARRNWLRAMNYYQAAAYPIDLSQDRRHAAVAAMRNCATNYLRHRQPAGEVVSIPWLQDFPLQGYFLPSPAGKDRSPAVICIGEPGHRKEEFLFKVAHHAGERGIALLAVDLLGEGTEVRFEEILQRHKLESAINSFADYLAERDDVDADRIAILGDNWSSSFVARGIAFDQRFAAAVCDGGVWDAHERAFIRKRALPVARDSDRNWETNRLLRSIQCPVLVTLGEKGWLESDRVIELTDQPRSGDRDLTLKIFRQRETAAAQGHLDNPTLANEFIFDWIASRLRRVRLRQA
jgi:dienelactone hydrolase